MIARIAAKERLELVRDGRFRLAGGVVGVLLLAALLLGAAHYRDTSRQHAEAQALTRRHWEAQGSRNPHSAAHYGIYAFKPRLPLSIVDEGVDPYTGVSVWLEAHKQNEFRYRPAQDATALQRFGELTAATTLQLLLPLLIILFTFPAFAGEREQGTLRQLLSLGVAPRALVAGKALGTAGALALLLVPATLAGVGALGLASGGAAFGATLPRLGVLVLAYLLYFTAWTGLGLALSARARSARAALVALLALWMANALVAPRVATDLARRLHPTPSALAFASAMQSELTGEGTTAAREKALEQRVLRQYGVDSISKLPVSFAGLALQDGEEHGNEVFDRHYGRLWATFFAQERVRQAAGFAAPLLAVRGVSMGLAGTDLVQHRHFAEAAERYRRVLVKAMNDDMTEHAAGRDFEYKADASLWTRVPPFTYTAPSLGEVLATHAPGLAALALWALAGVVLAALATRRVAVTA